MNKLFLLLAVVFPIISIGAEWPGNDGALDKLLKEMSPTYKAMAATVQERRGYRIQSSVTTRLGIATYDKDGFIIKLNPKLRGARRATVLIWEMCNAFQRPQFDEIDRRVRARIITSSKEFGLRMEIIEYDNFRRHRKVLKEMESTLGAINTYFLFFINPKLKQLQDYAIPNAHDYIEAQSKGGHTKHYEEWYYRQRGEKPLFKTKEN